MNPNGIGQGGQRRSSSTRLPRRNSIVEFMRAIMEEEDEDGNGSGSGSGSSHGPADPVPPQHRQANFGDDHGNSSQNNSAAIIASSLESQNMPRPPSRQEDQHHRQQQPQPPHAKQHTIDDSLYSNISPDDLGNYLLDSDGDHRMEGEQSRQKHSGGSTDAFASSTSFTSRVADIRRTTAQFAGSLQQQQQQQQFDTSAPSWSSFGLHDTSTSIAHHPAEDTTNFSVARRAASLDLAPKRSRDNNLHTSSTDYSELQASLAATSAAVQREEDSYLHAAGLPFHQPIEPFALEEQQLQKQQQQQSQAAIEQGFHSSLPNLGEEDRNTKRQRLMLSGRKAVSERVVGSGPMYKEQQASSPSNATPSSVQFASTSSRNLVDMRHDDLSPLNNNNSQLYAFLQGSPIQQQRQQQGNTTNMGMSIPPFQQQQSQHQGQQVTSSAAGGPFVPTAMDFTTNLSPILVPQSPIASTLTPEVISRLLGQQQQQQRQQPFQQNLTQAVPAPPFAAFNAPNPALNPAGSPTVLGPSGLPQQPQIQLPQGQIFPGQHQQQYQPNHQGMSMASNTAPRLAKMADKNKVQDASPSFERKGLSVAFDTTPLLPPSIPLSEELGTSMKASQQSQQNIHDWDRAMGLRRSHSKTMRASMRSRKKLQEVRAIQDMFGISGLVRREERAKSA